MTSVGRVLTVASHELRAALRSRILVVLLVVLVCMTVVSVLVSSAQYAGQLADYLAYRDAAVAGGVQRVAPSPLALLSLLRGALEYVEIVGAVVAITLGYLSVSRERSARTMPLLRSRPVSPAELATGSALGALALISILVTCLATVAVLSLGLIGHDWIGGVQVPKLVLAYLAAVVYLFVFYCLGAVATSRARVPVNGLMVALGIWLLVGLVLPQIGDTLDADNQVPGGLFAALGLGHDGEVTILAHLSGYERVRTGIEEASFTKHFERFAFAMTDVKERYRSLSLTQLFVETRNDIAWLVAYPVALSTALWLSFRAQPTTPTGGTS
ncbi:ABC transporter permease [Jannaschia sp. R86511]|uniref:ABC transporter permease n=1 Tax=Jannaschia sp. R86511 TaxID=3093853 RepID=UPI0036D2B4BA